MSSEQKKQSTIVHKPFLTGQINIFNPPKANPNGRLASAKLLTKDIKKRPNNFLFEQINRQTENHLNSRPLDNPSSESIEFSGKKTTLIAIAIVLIANILSAIVLLTQKPKTELSPEPEIEQINPSQVGNIDLSSKEFIELKASNLSTVPPTPTEEDSLLQQTETDPTTMLPLAIPPLNIAQRPNSYSTQIPTQYYYILSEYTGDSSLALAKEKVPNVSLITLEEGVFIYMGAFGQKELAQQFLEKLKKEGFYAYIYPSEG
ncbi:hypothetical protein Xen7305DRAFT_00041570 [Xenococcus sp. PCC 7305]|uniref:SPOR domain-containing protein n=1 Tax=Xenococcus sp. PCC 7305 TaxID=102125 RepID=UPI0002AC1CF0|nr:SPOR domain-containing protein [Xenococcus sp. PCC 7305]ELS04424.1 hypothetical protein Xen7305DRAFT_00041570 [Xenococcus sp. PCC 7305]